MDVLVSFMAKELAELFSKEVITKVEAVMGVVTSVTPLFVQLDSSEVLTPIGPLQYLRNRPLLGDKVILLRDKDLLIVVGNSGEQFLITGKDLNGSLVVIVVTYNPTTGYLFDQEPLYPKNPNPGNVYADQLGPVTMGASYHETLQGAGPTGNTDIVFLYRSQIANVLAGEASFSRIEAIVRRGSVYGSPFPLTDYPAHPAHGPWGFGTVAAINEADTGGGGSLPGFIINSNTQEYGSDLYKMSDGTLYIRALSNPTGGISGAATLYRRDPGGTWNAGPDIFANPLFDATNTFTKHVRDFIAVQDGDTIYFVVRGSEAITFNDRVCVGKAVYLGGGTLSVTFSAMVSPFTGTANLYQPQDMFVTSDAFHVMNDPSGLGGAFCQLTSFDKTTLAQIQIAQLPDILQYNPPLFDGFPDNLLPIGPIDIFDHRGDTLWTSTRVSSGVQTPWILLDGPHAPTYGFNLRFNWEDIASGQSILLGNGNKGRFVYVNAGPNGFALMQLIYAEFTAP